MKTQLIHGDCMQRLKELPDNSVDAVVTDPPYGLSFMGKKWDYDVPSENIWRECLRVLKPGGHLLAFAGTRTQHRMAVRIEDAGFEIRDMIAWVYGSGFPKSLDVSKAIDRAAGALAPEGKNFRVDGGSGTASYRPTTDPRDYVPPAPATPEAQQWSGWGTALKPALEPVTVARKPLTGTVAANVLEYGTAALNVDGCRVGTRTENESGWSKTGSKASENRSMSGANYDRNAKDEAGTGRWPANLIHDGSEEVVGLFPSPHGAGCARVGSDNPRATSEKEWQGPKSQNTGKMHRFGDTGSAARFFYCAKASKRDRDEGCEGLAAKNRADQSAWVRKCNVCGDTFCDPATSKPHCGHDDFGWVEPSPRRNHHPTVKPTALMRYLCRLVTPPGGTVLDPFMGSGSTGKAAMLEGFSFIGIEREVEYLAIAEARIKHAESQCDMLTGQA